MSETRTEILEDCRFTLEVDISTSVGILAIPAFIKGKKTCLLKTLNNQEKSQILF